MSLLYVASTADAARWRALPYPGVAVRPAQAPTLMASGTFSLVLVELPAAHPQLLPLCRAPRGAAALTVLLQDAGNPALCLRAGADQCLPASVSLRELNARLQVLRRGQSAVQAPADLWLSLGLPRLGSGERSVGLSLEEQRLLEVLARHGGVLPRGQLEALLWHDHHDAHPARLHRLAANVRRKLGEVGADQTLETLRGFGYRLNQPLALREH